MTPVPWPEVTYDNDTGPADESFYEWWEIPGVAKFNDEDDALFARNAANSFRELTAALFAVTDTYWGVHDDRNGDGKGEPPAVIVQARAALKNARPPHLSDIPS